MGNRSACAVQARRFLYVSVAGNAVLLIVLIIVYFYQNHLIQRNVDFSQTLKTTELEFRSRHPNVTVVDDTVCLECNYLGKDVKVEETLYTNISYSDCGTRLCCLQDKSIAKLLRQIMTIREADLDNESDSQSLSWWRQRPNSAHLYLKDWDRSRLLWTEVNRTGSAFSNLKIKDNNKLVIKEQGLYFVYSALVFDFGKIKKVPQIYYNITSFFPPAPHFSPFIVMGKYGGSRFSDRQHTGYLSGIVKLYPSHQISVSINDHRFINPTAYGNFFGVFKL
ncbi:uncharacterized protein LOC133202298 [Saccostrea echinata]|uniref:uncharacterized protein LOC133202298 n=1 Tax=Saccostrea echinata TaxID=191078 RepID=UPI002A7F756F|nr:uncharacterized protein LOC133202298 [Saccostrea echinata]